MEKPSVKSDLISIANSLPDSATYAEAMYQLYVRMKVAQGQKAARQGLLIPHEQVIKTFYNL